MYFEDRPIKEIAAILGCTETSAKVRAFRARPKLKKILMGIIAVEENE
jgi:DNA-directed RNA polymerase specialized sigma24 family protein